MKKRLTPRQAWETALGQLQIQVNKANYLTFLRDTQGLSYDGRLFVIQVPTAFAREWLEKRLHSLVQRTLAGILRQEVEVKFQEVPSAYLEDEPGLAGQSRRHNGADSLNPKYTFSTFVVGQCNRLAHAAALSVAEAPGKSYNPLFIYGGTGLGKTHLLHAIGHLASTTNLAALYVTSEQFTNEFVSSIRERKTEEFRARFRSVDLLLIDDIQFLVGKEQTQEGLFHTFNDLHNANHHIVLSSDRPPKALPLIEERLRSRFEWGLTADIQPPDLETRQAILATKAEDQGIALPHAVVDLLARKVRRNVRELEGALNRVLAFAQLAGGPLTPELASQALAEAPAEEKRRQATPDQVIKTVSEYYKVGIPLLTSPRRDQPLAKARQVAMYLLRETLGLTLTEIGQALGGRDHKTVHHGYSHIATALNDDLQLRHEVLELQERLAALPATSPHPVPELT